MGPPLSTFSKTAQKRKAKQSPKKALLVCLRAVTAIFRHWTRPSLPLAVGKLQAHDGLVHLQLSNPKAHQPFEFPILWAGDRFSMQPPLAEQIPLTKPTNNKYITDKSGCQITSQFCYHPHPIQPKTQRGEPGSLNPSPSPSLGSFSF